MGRFAGCVGFLLFLFLSPFLSEASDTHPKKELQKNLEQSKLIINNAKDKLSKGLSVTDEINQLKAAAENIKAAHLLVQEQFSAGEDSVKPLGAKAIDRHKTMTQGYQKALEEYLALIDGLSNEQSDISSQLSAISSLLDRILPKKKRPIFGSLPYNHLNYPAKEPNQNSAITPAYKGGNKTVSSEDRKNTEEAPISAEIAAFAQSLNWNPVSIYEYVKNNVETEWYWGCMKGAEETLRQKSGNDCDQATLLAALLRASGYPVRYVRGVIEFFPDIEKAKNLTGINDPQKIAEFFQKAGIPYKTVVAGGRISNIQIEHVWVESQIPYANYRGAVLDEYGKTWLGLDTSIKVTGYTYNQATDGAWQIANGLRDEYLNSAQTQTPLDYLKGKLSDVGSQQNPQLTADSYKLTRTLVPEVLNILPASLQFTEVKITNEYTAIPDELAHKVKFIAKDSKNSELLNAELKALSLSNKPIAISYEPETIEDQQIINSYGGLSNTPAYLVRLRPTLKINGERIAVATDGLPMGADFSLTIELKSPGAAVQRITNTHVVGNLSVIGITAQKTNGISQTANSETKSAEQILYEEAMSYTNRWNQAEDEIASLFHLSIARPIPTVVTIGGVIDVTYLLDTPHGFEWKGVFVDASLKAIETAISHELSAISQNDIEKTFMQLSSLQGSILENKIFEDDFKVESISTAKLIQLSHEQSANSYELIAIDKSNITTILPTLLLDDNIKEDIQNAVNQNLTVKIPAISNPPSEITYQDWTGIGYIKENLETGESGWMLSGMIAGGMTAWQTDKWPPEIYGILSNPYAEPPSTDSLSGTNIQKVPGTDLQRGIAGSLIRPLMVKVFDQKGRVVPEAEVIFTVKAGGGKLIDPKTNVEATTITVKTSSRGIGTVYFRLGKETKENASYVQLNAGDKYFTQIGENIIDASLKSSGISVPKPFTAYGIPGEATKMIPLHGDGTDGKILSFAGFISVLVADKNDNPISNLPVVFTVQSAIDGSTGGYPLVCKNLNQDTRQAAIFEKTDECMSKSPTLGECQSENSTITQLTSNKGASVEVILGGIPYGIYPIEAKYENMSYKFNLYTYAFGNCDGETPPSLELKVNVVYFADSQGNNITAGKVGTPIPVTARMYLIKEGEEQKDQELPCENGKMTCEQIVGSRVYTIEKDLTSSTVTFAGQQGTSQGGGVYTSEYTLQPGKNTINIAGTATIEADRSNNTCDGGCTTIKQQIPLTDTTQITVYGVDIKADPLPLILIDEKGYTTTDYKITYKIEPLEYQALTAYAFIYKDGNPDPIAQIPTEIKGAGFATISRGFQFDINSRYEMEVVLNYGTRVEMKSETIYLPVGQIKMVTNDEEQKPVVGAVTDGATTIKIQLIVKYNRDALQPNLEWTISDLGLPENLVAIGTLMDGENPVEYYPVTFNSDGIAEAIYKVPDTFVRFGTSEETNDKESPERSIQIELNTQETGFPTIRLKRTPVVLVHGLWGNGLKTHRKYVWDVFEEEFNKKRIYDIFSVDYHDEKLALSIKFHAPKLRNKIGDVIGELIKQKFAATKVDIIAHSLGGLLTREYCYQFDVECQNKIKRFITIDTPHEGSELADKLLLYRDDIKNFPDFPLCKLLVGQIIKGMDINITLIRGLDIMTIYSISPHPIYPSPDQPFGSEEASQIDNLSTFRPPDNYSKRERAIWKSYSFIENAFSAHTISGISPNTSPGFLPASYETTETWALWKYVLAPCGFTRENVFNLQSNDGIVTQTSQEGGVPSNNTTLITNVDHQKVRTHPLTIGKIKDLLDEPKGSTLFTK